MTRTHSIIAVGTTLFASLFLILPWELAWALGSSESRSNASKTKVYPICDSPQNELASPAQKNNIKNLKSTLDRIQCPELQQNILRFLERDYAKAHQEFIQSLNNALDQIPPTHSIATAAQSHHPQDAALHIKAGIEFFINQLRDSKTIGDPKAVSLEKDYIRRQLKTEKSSRQQGGCNRFFQLKGFLGRTITPRMGAISEEDWNNPQVQSDAFLCLSGLKDSEILLSRALPNSRGNSQRGMREKFIDFYSALPDPSTPNPKNSFIHSLPSMLDKMSSLAAAQIRIKNFAKKNSGNRDQEDQQAFTQTELREIRTKVNLLIGDPASENPSGELDQWSRTLSDLKILSAKTPWAKKLAAAIQQLKTKLQELQESYRETSCF